jgi:hypothetical protein
VKRVASIGTVTTMAIAFSGGVAFAAKPPTHALTMNAIELVNGLLSFEYETAPSSLFSLHAGMSFLVSEALHPNDAVSAFAIGPEVGARLFFLGDAPSGFWIGPFGGLSFVSGKKNLERQGELGFTAGVLAGVSWVVFDQMMVSAGVGAGYHDLSAEIDGTEAGMRGWSPRLRLSAGMAF